LSTRVDRKTDEGMESNKADQKRVIVFGSAHQDLTLSVASFPAPGETTLARSLTREFGGKGANQAVAASAAGASVTFVGVVGRDEWAERILNNLARNEVDTRFVSRSPHQPSGLAVVVVDKDGANQIVVAPGAGAAFDTSVVQPAMEVVTPGDVVVVQCEIPFDTVALIVDLAARARAVVVLNLAPFTSLSADTLATASLIIVNESEARSLLRSDSGGTHLARRVAEVSGSACIVTLGDRGSSYASPTGDEVVIPPHPVDKVVDTTGAGDVYVGTIAAALARGDGIRTAMAGATFAAAQSVLAGGAQSRLSAPAVQPAEQHV
jgi:ribokinase